MKHTVIDYASVVEAEGLDVEGVPAAWLQRAAEELGRGQKVSAERYLDAGRSQNERAELDDRWHGFEPNI